MASFTPGVYTDIKVFIDGQLLTQSTSVSLAQNSNNTEVRTTVRGWAGIKPGPEDTVISITAVVPVDGFEIDTNKVRQKNQPVTITLYSASQQLSCTGFFMSQNFNDAVGGEAPLTFEFKGGPAEWRS